MKSTNKIFSIKPIKKKWQHTLILLGILLITFAIGITALIFLHKASSLDLSFAYSVTDQMYGNQSTTADMQKADAFASSYCVSSGNKSMDGIAVSDTTNAGLFDLEHHTVLYGQDLHEKAYPASITKIMTAILAFKYGNLDDIVTIPADALHQEEGSTEIGFQEGDQITLDELLHGLLIYSGNDAAVAIAHHIGGSIDEFVAMMNQEALSIGATNTHFVNPSGLHDENHYTTVYDIYLMLQEAMTYSRFLDISQLSSYNLTCTRGEETVTFHLDATDQYLTRQVTPPKNVTILGGKTGTTSAAGSCLALLSQNAYGQPYISIVLHAANKSTLYSYMNQLLSVIN